MAAGNAYAAKAMLLIELRRIEIPYALSHRWACANLLIELRRIEI